MFKFSRANRMVILLLIDIAFFFLEITVGMITKSLALIADSFHMLNDVISLLIAFWALRYATKPATKIGYTYGWQRAEILGALVNGVFLIALSVSIFLEAIQRFIEVPVINNPRLILIVGSCGLASNLIGMCLFHSHGPGHNHGHGQNHSHLISAEGQTDLEENPFLTSSVFHGARAINSNAVSDDLDIDSVMPRTVVEQFSQRSRSLSKHNYTEARSDKSYSKRESISQHSKNIPSGEGSPKTDSDDNEAFLCAYHDHSDHKHSQAAAGVDNSSRKHGNLNMKGVFLHVLGDALGNIGVIIAALIIWKTNKPWRFYFDPIISVLITFIILLSAIPLCKAAAQILLQAAPNEMDVEAIIADICAIKGVLSVHDVHIWQLSEAKMIATVHVMIDIPVDHGEAYMNLTASICDCLRAYGILSCTIQPEFNNVGFVSQNGKRILKKMNDDEIQLDTDRNVCLMDKIDSANTKSRCCGAKNVTIYNNATNTT